MRRERSKQVSLRALLGGSLAVLILGVWLVTWQWGAVRGLICPAAATGSPPPFAADPSGDVGVDNDTPQSGPAELDAAARSWKLLSVPAVWPMDLSDPKSCEEAQADLDRICAVLDARPYVVAARPPGGVCGLLASVAEELASRPPRLSSELTSYAAMLDNVFHLFRVVGRDRLELLRRVAREEAELAEPISMAWYRWLISRERCARSGASRIRTQALYEYAGFLFQTMGGQAYLRRRPPDVEALTAFYALVVLDRAIEAKQNPHGIDPRREIERTRRLIENQSLLFRAHYIEMLDDMALRWESRAAAERSGR